MKWTKHKSQGVSLLVAIALLMVPYGEHMVNMLIASGIILVNAILEFKGDK